MTDFRDGTVMKFIAAVVVEKAVMLDEGRGRGTIVCPKCGGDVHVTLAPANAHARAACATPGCLRLIE